MRNKLKDDEKYQILVVDAFSSDAIPIHLLTYEAMVMYFEKMPEDGILCFHISNRHLNLKPVLGNLAAKYTREPQRSRSSAITWKMTTTPSARPLRRGWSWRTIRST